MNSGDITAIVLAGGRGSRMDGRDKGLVELCGKPLVQWVVDAIRSQAGYFLISANRNLPDYERLGWPVVIDSMADFQGPLAGILSCAKRARSEFVVVAAADAPVLPPDYVARLHKAIIESQAELAVASVDGRLQPTHVMFQRRLSSDLEQWLQQGNRKVQDWIERQKHVVVEFSSDQSAFRNINDQQTLDDLSRSLCQ